MSKTLEEGMTLGELQAKHAKGPSRRVRMLVKRHLLMLEKGKSCFNKANDALTKAMNFGLKPGQVLDVEVAGKDGKAETIALELIDNAEVMRETGRLYRPARVPHFELKEVPKYRRKPKEEIPAEVA
jgi:bifunctional DNA-binding transcriptional regulator/antitoxin component of YhaV-PrlF toxin-antitoxin module